MDSNLLANLICESLERGENFCTLQSTLSQYERRAKIYNYGMQTGLEILGETYGSQIGAVKYLRNIGVN